MIQSLFIGLRADLLTFLTNARPMIIATCDATNRSKPLRKNAFELKHLHWLDKNTELRIAIEKYNVNVGAFVEISFKHYLNNYVSAMSPKGKKDLDDNRRTYTEIKSIIVDLPYLTDKELNNNKGMIVITEESVYRVKFSEDFKNYLKSSCKAHINTDKCCFKGKDTSKYYFKKPILDKYGVVATEYLSYHK